jgi:hypothetical protein
MHRIRATALGALPVLVFGLPRGAAAQNLDARLLLLPPGFVTASTSESPPTPQAAPDRRTPVTPALLSLALPGAGQHVLGQRRRWIYAAVEIVGWMAFLERRSAGADYRDRYRDHAWEAGRIQTGGRLDGDFEYYERMSDWARSGFFDTDPGTAGVQPETDSTTYNGSVWELAGQIYLPGGAIVPVTDPAYQAALAYYGERAYPTPFLWDWTGAPGGMQRLADLIDESDSRFRQATTALGAVIANHLVSAADAYISSRGLSSPVGIRVVPDRSARGGSWRAVLTVPLGR